MGPLRVSFVERESACGPWRIERVPHPELAELDVHCMVAEDRSGELLIGVSLRGRRELEAFAERHRAKLLASTGDGGSIAARQLREYLEGTRREFDLRVAALGTEFEQAAWAALCEIPFGETRSYGEQARAIHNPGGARAVGRANSRNPNPIVVPCHRVIGSDGSLTGFAGGLPLKRWLLRHEAVPLAEADEAVSQLGLFTWPHEFVDSVPG